MQPKTKNPPSGVGSKHSNNLNHGIDSLAKRERLTQSLKDAFNAGQIPASGVAELARIGGCHV